MFEPMCIFCGRTAFWKWNGIARVAIFSAFCLGSATVSAAADIQLENIITLALCNNADLRSFQLKWEALQERPEQEKALPDPMLTYSTMGGNSGEQWSDTYEHRLMLQQEFPWFGKRQLRGDIARQDAEVMRLEVEAMKRDLTMAVKEAYFDLYGVQHAIAWVRADDETLRHMVDITEAMYANGERSQQDVLKAKAEVTMLLQRMLELETQENVLKAKLNMLLNRPAETPVGTAVTQPLTNSTGQISSFLALAAMRPEVRAAEAQAERYKLQGRLMEKESYPNYRLGAEYRQIDNHNDAIMLTIGFDLPIRTSKYEAGVREAEKMQAASETARQSEIRKSAFDVQDAWFKWQSACATLALYRDQLIPQAIARFEASKIGYSTGKVDFLDLLESQRFLLTARIMAAMTEGSIGMQAARLERAVGMEIQAKPGEGDRHANP